MSFKLAEAFVSLGVRDAGLKGGLRQAKTSISQSLAGIGGAFGVQLGLAGALFGAGLVVKIASDAEEIQSKFEAVFKELTADGQAFAQNFGRTVGRSVIDTKRSLSEFQDVLIPIGFTRNEGLEMSKILLTLSTDLASFNNKSDEQAAQAVRKALLGEREMMKELGVSILESDVKLRLAQKGQKAFTGNALKQAKALATLELITELSTDAMGDAIRTGKGFANQLKGTQGAAKDLAATVGSVLLPRLADGLGSVTDVLRSVEASFVDMIPAIEMWANTLADAGNFVRDAFDDLGFPAEDLERGLVTSFFDTLGIEITNFEKNLKLLGANLGSGILQGLAPNADITRSLRVMVRNLGSELEQESAAMQRFMDEARELNRSEFKAGRVGGRGGAPTRGGGAASTKPISGFFGFDALAKKIQEQTLKTSKPQEKMVGLMEADKMVQQRQLRAAERMAQAFERVVDVGPAPSLVAESAR